MTNQPDAIWIVAVKGCILGFVFAVTLVSGTVWSVQVALRRGFTEGFGAGAAIGLGQVLWVLMAVLAWTHLEPLYPFAYSSIRWSAAIIFGYMALRMFRAQKVEQLSLAKELPPARQLFWQTLLVSGTMPMRTFAYFAFCIGAGLELYHNRLLGIPVFLASVLFGFSAWILYMAGLAHVFGKRVPEGVSVRSVNKLNFLAGAIFLAMAVIVLVPLMQRSMVDPG